MESVFPSKYSRLSINLFFAYLGSVTLIAGVLMVRLSRNWTISDWLINYEGGFIRRGLPGQIAFDLGRYLHLSPVFFAAVFYLSLVAALLVAFRSLALATSYNVWVLALVVSPATLSFAILHPQAGFRKEIIFLAALAVFVALLRKTERSSLWVAVYMTTILTAGTLSHEVVIFYSPYFFAALVLCGRSVPKAVKECVVPFAAGAVVLYACSTHLGNLEVAAKVCSSLGYKLLVPGSTEICASGAIPYLTKSREAARTEAFGLIRPSLWGCLSFFCIAGAGAGDWRKCVACAVRPETRDAGAMDDRRRHARCIAAFVCVWHRLGAVDLYPCLQHCHAAYAGRREDGRGAYNWDRSSEDELPA